MLDHGVSVLLGGQLGANPVGPAVAWSICSLSTSCPCIEAGTTLPCWSASVPLAWFVPVPVDLVHYLDDPGAHDNQPNPVHGRVA
jgi:hypothetical protein